jgi:hypothetical protein
MSLTSVQTQVFDTFGALFAGQLADYASNTLAKDVRSFRTEDSVIFGRGVVKGTANAQGDPILTPYGVKTPLAGSLLADFAGIAILPESSTSDANNLPTTVRETTMIPVAELGSGAIVGAVVPAGITIVHGDPVYMSVSHVSIPVGAFSNAAATGLIAITGATWYGAAAASTVGRIKL